MKGRSPFLESLLAVTALVSLAFSLVLSLHRPEPATAREGADSFSRGPVGHRAFLEFLEALGVKAERFRSFVYDSPRDPLFFLEPEPEAVFGGKAFGLRPSVVSRVEMGLPTVLVLPKWKWEGKKSVFRLEDLRRVESVLRAAFPRPEEAPMLSRKSLGPGKADEPILVSAADGIPSLMVHLPMPQVMELRNLGQPLLGRPDACLAAGFPDRDGPLFVVSDPDLLHNFNLGRANHGTFWAAFLGEILQAEKVYLDESFHGFGLLPSLGEELASFPGILLLVQVILLLLGMGWAAFHRFGPPLRVGEGGRGAAISLVEAGAGILERALPGEELAREYVECILRDAAERLHLPPGRDMDTLALSLDRAASARGVDPGAREALSAAHSGMEGARRAWAFRRRLLGKGRGKSG